MPNTLVESDANEAAQLERNWSQVMHLLLAQLTDHTDQVLKFLGTQSTVLWYALQTPQSDIIQETLSVVNEYVEVSDTVTRPHSRLSSVHEPNASVA
jgi:hypothetical protein